MNDIYQDALPLINSLSKLKYNLLVLLIMLGDLSA